MNNKTRSVRDNPIHEMNLVAIHLSVINHQSSVSGDYALRDEVLSQIPQIKKIPDSEISA
ncbi:MAG: hypothetical protein H8E57_09830 [Candidatus Cloacimonetes bacterium]|nr:hypothetical protein [Candidatus Cloacimonadota bacterium]